MNMRTKPGLKHPLQRRPLAAYRLRRCVDWMDAVMDSAPIPRERHPLFEVALVTYGLWADLAHPTRIYTL